jgi:membrane associated rhomboid family serine protease
MLLSAISVLLRIASIVCAVLTILGGFAFPFPFARNRDGTFVYGLIAYGDNDSGSRSAYWNCKDGTEFCDKCFIPGVVGFILGFVVILTHVTRSELYPDNAPASGWKYPVFTYLFMAICFAVQWILFAAACYPKIEDAVTKDNLEYYVAFAASLFGTVINVLLAILRWCTRSEISS